MIEKVTVNGKHDGVLSFEAEDTLEIIASRMECTVYDLEDLLTYLYECKWNGNPIVLG